MLFRILITMLALMPLTMKTEAGLWDSLKSMFGKDVKQRPPVVKVLALHDLSGAVLEVRGPYKIINPHTHTHISTRFVGKRKLLEALPEGLKWGEEFPGVYQLLLVPDSPETVMSVDGAEFRGLLYIYDIGGTISIVNEVDIEDYLKTILTPKYLETLPQESLAAYAIAARTNAYFLSLNPKNNYWHIDGRQVGYNGWNSMNPKSPMMAALRQTRYMVMSTTGTYEGYVTPFVLQWETIPVGGPVKDKPRIGKISLHDAEEQAKKGDHAAQILSKAFPGVMIQRMYDAEHPYDVTSGF
jgi:stage II sporulation protein D